MFFLYDWWSLFLTKYFFVQFYIQFIFQRTDSLLHSFQQHFLSFSFSFYTHISSHLYLPCQLWSCSMYCCFSLLFSPPTSHPNMSLPPPLTSLLLTSSYSITSMNTAILQCILPTILCVLPHCEWYKFLMKDTLYKFLVGALIISIEEENTCNTEFANKQNVFVFLSKIVHHLYVMDKQMQHILYSCKIKCVIKRQLLDICSNTRILATINCRGLL